MDVNVARSPLPIFMDNDYDTITSNICGEPFNDVKNLIVTGTSNSMENERNYSHFDLMNEASHQETIIVSDSWISGIQMQLNLSCDINKDHKNSFDLLEDYFYKSYKKSRCESLGKITSQIIEIGKEERNQKFSIFESVRAVIKREVYNYLQLQSKSEVFEAMRTFINSAIHIYELELDKFAIIGSLRDLLLCQKYLNWCMNSEDQQVMNEAFSKNSGSDKHSKKKTEVLTTSIDRKQKTSISKGKQTFQCKQCSFSCSVKKDFLSHSDHHHKVPHKTIYSCENCSFTSNRASQLKNHMKLDCKILPDQSFTSKAISSENEPDSLMCNDIVRTSVATAGIEDFQCFSLNNKRTNKDLSHLAVVNEKCNMNLNNRPDEEEPVLYKCTKCDYTTYKKPYFVRHVKSIHEETRPYICVYCNRGFKRADSLKQHYIVHIKEGKAVMKSRSSPYECLICRKVVRSAAYLKEHMFTHSNERQYLCELCGASFKTRAVQRNHARVVHSETKSNSCPRCKKKFATKFSLARHVAKRQACKIEEDELPYVDEEISVFVADESGVCKPDLTFANISSDATYSISIGDPLPVSHVP